MARGQIGWKSRGRMRTEWMSSDGEIKAEAVDAAGAGSSGHTINAEQFGAWTYFDSRGGADFGQAIASNLGQNNGWLLTRFEQSLSTILIYGRQGYRTAARQGYRTFS